MNLIENGTWEVVDNNETLDVFYRPGYLFINTITDGGSFKCDVLKSLGQNGNCKIPLTGLHRTAGGFPVVINNMDVQIEVESKTSFAIIPYGRDGVVLRRVDESS
jgi:hypothetical protein